MKEEISELRKSLGIDDWLELVKEDKNLNGAYISFGQYIYILEKQNTELKERYNNMFECHCNRVEVEKIQNNLNELKKWIEDYKELCNWCDKELFLSFNKQEIKCCERILDKMQELEESDIK